MQIRNRIDDSFVRQSGTEESLRFRSEGIERSLGERQGDRESEIPVQDEHRRLRSVVQSYLAKITDVEGLQRGEDVSREEAIQRAQQVLGVLKGFQNEWREFLAKLVRIDVTHTGFSDYGAEQVQAAAVEQYTRDLLDQPELQSALISSPLTTHVLSQDGNVIEQSLLDYVEQQIPAICERMIQQLDFLVTLGVCGLIARYPNQTCEYFYGYRRIEIDVEEPTVLETYIGRFDPNDLTRGLRKTTRKISAKTRLLTCLQRHQMIHMIELNPQSGVVMVPRFHQQVIAAIPGWLRDEVRLIEGTLVGAQRIEQESEVREITHEESQVVDIYYHNDPALVLGQYVLTGWGPQEIQAEQARKEEPATDKTPVENELMSGMQKKLVKFFSS